jgi:predicted PurR-regulated permease PerM
MILTKTEFFNKWFNHLNLFTQNQVDQLSGLLQRICHLVLVSSVLVAAVQALVVSVACYFSGYTDFMMIFMITFFMSFLPVIGSAPISIAMIIYSFLNSNITGVVILIAGAVITGSIDNIIRTYMLTTAEKEGAHPFVALLALIGSLSLFGFLGLFLGPIICELAYRIGGILLLNSNGEIQVTESNQETV